MCTSAVHVESSASRRLGEADIEVERTCSRVSCHRLRGVFEGKCATSTTLSSATTRREVAAVSAFDNAYLSTASQRPPGRALHCSWKCLYNNFRASDNTGFR